MAKMAILRAFMGLASIGALVQLAMGASLAIGGAGGSWDLNTDLQTWASSQTFNPGDSLTFTYTSIHNVLEVSKADYDACQTSSPLTSDSSGTTVIRLSAPGKRYFICGTPGHCSGGMKVEINTITAATSTPPPASPATPPPAPSPPTKSPSAKSPAHAPTPKLASPATPPPSPSPPTKSPPVKSPAHAPTPSMKHEGHDHNGPSQSPAVAPSEAPPASSVLPPVSPTGSTPQQSAVDGSGLGAKTAACLGIGLLMLLAL